MPALPHSIFLQTFMGQTQTGHACFLPLILTTTNNECSCSMSVTSNTLGLFMANMVVGPNGNWIPFGYNFTAFMLSGYF